MFERKTFESLMQELLSLVPDSFDKREGSVIYDALAPCAVELSNAYIDMDAVLNQTYASTALGEYLDKRVGERGITRISATKAILKAVFTPSTVEIPIGARFNCDQLNYAITEKIDDGEYKIECETAGTEGNIHFGVLIPIEYISGLQTAALTELLISARDAETDDALRERYFDSMTAQAFGGNIADYKQRTKTIPDLAVGGVKVVPVWNGAGTVKVIIQDSTGGIPSDELVDAVQNALDPVGHSGQGYGIAPIGHTVTVDGITKVAINIACTITYETGWDWESAQAYIKSSLDDYFKELRSQWEDLTNIVVRISQIESRILNSQGVLDISGTTLNGSSSNISLTTSQIAERGTINGNA